MAGLGANGSAVSPRDRRRVCHWASREAHCRHQAVRSCPPNRQRVGRAVVGAVARRVPFWSVLVGIYVAAGFWTLPPKIAQCARQRAVRRRGSVADVPGIGSARQARPHTRASARLFSPDDDAHREPRSHRRCDCRLAGRPDRTGPADYADSDRSWRRRSRRRAGAAGHTLESLCGFS